MGEQHVSNTRYQNGNKFSKAYSFLYKTAHMCFSLLMMITSHNPATGLYSGCQILYTASTQQTSCCCTSQFGYRHPTKVTPVNCPAPKSAAKARQYVSHKAFACLPATPALGLQVKWRDSDDRVTLYVSVLQNQLEGAVACRLCLLAQPGLQNKQWLLC